MEHAGTHRLSFALSALGHAAALLAVALLGAGGARSAGGTVNVMLVDGSGALPRAEISAAEAGRQVSEPVPESERHALEAGPVENEVVSGGQSDETASASPSDISGSGMSPGQYSEIAASIEAALVYPPMARKRGLEGRVVAMFLVDVGGMPSGIRVMKSSGHDLLDQAAVSAIERASPYPAYVRRVEVPVTFRLGR